MTTKEKILQASKKLFAQHGFHQTTTMMIANEVRIKKPSLYHHFSSKESIYVQLVCETLFEIQKLTSDDKAHNMQWVIQKIFELSKKNGPFLFSVHNISTTSLKTINREVQQYRETLIAYFESHELKAEVSDVVTLIMDLSQSYARAYHEQKKSMTPSQYATLLTKLISST